MECSKVKYASKSMADDDIIRIARKSKREIVPIRSYLCGKCGGWHLTSRQDMFRLSEKEKMENKKIAELTEQVRKLKEENSMLKDKNHREISKEVNESARITKLTSTLR